MLESAVGSDARGFGLIWEINELYPFSNKLLVFPTKPNRYFWGQGKSMLPRALPGFTSQAELSCSGVAGLLCVSHKSLVTDNSQKAYREGKRFLLSGPPNGGHKLKPLHC